MHIEGAVIKFTGSDINHRGYTTRELRNDKQSGERVEAISYKAPLRPILPK